MLNTTERPAPTVRPRVVATLILASVGAFVTSLDVVVVSTALPSLRAHLGASLSDLEWTINAYNLAFASLMLTGQPRRRAGSGLTINSSRSWKGSDYAEQPHGKCRAIRPPAEAMRHNPDRGIMRLMPISA